MSEETVQYYFKQSLWGASILWIKKRVERPDIDQLGHAGPMRANTIERKATPSEAAAILPILNAGLRQSS